MRTRLPAPRAHLHGGPAERRVLRPVLGVVRQLGVVAVVAALGVLQVQDGRALDREGRPLPGALIPWLCAAIRSCEQEEKP